MTRSNLDIRRYKQIHKLRLDGMKFREIGEKLGISRQRAWEIFKRIEKIMAEKAEAQSRKQVASEDSRNMARHDAMLDA